MISYFIPETRRQYSWRTAETSPGSFQCRRITSKYDYISKIFMLKRLFYRKGFRIIIMVVMVSFNFLLMKY